MKLSYVLIKPAHNEDGNTEKTTEPVFDQTILPKTWATVNDLRTNSIQVIVKTYAQQ